MAGLYIRLPPFTPDTGGSDTDVPVTVDSGFRPSPVTADSVGSDTECSLSPKAKFFTF